MVFIKKQLGRRVKWTRKTERAELLRLYRAGIPVYERFLRRNYSGLIYAVWKFDKSLRRAVSALGISYDEIRAVRKPWSKREVCAGIRSLHKQGIPLNSGFIRKYWRRLMSAGESLYGNWGDAVSAAGIDYLNESKEWSSKAWLRSLSKKKMKKIATQFSSNKRR